jgi:hypothetical protein
MTGLEPEPAGTVPKARFDKLVADNRALVEQKDVIIEAIRADQRATESQLHDERNAHLATKLEREAWRRRAIAAEIVGDTTLLLDRIEKLMKERDAYRASRVELREALRVLVDTAVDAGKLLDAEVLPTDIDAKKEG